MVHGAVLLKGTCVLVLPGNVWLPLLRNAVAATAPFLGVCEAS